jgi:hypothetical protein
VLLMALLSLKALSGEKRSTRDVYGSYLRAWCTSVSYNIQDRGIMHLPSVVRRDQLRVMCTRATSIYLVHHMPSISWRRSTWIRTKRGRENETRMEVRKL